MTVGTPKVSSTKSCRRQCAQHRGVADQRRRPVPPVRGQDPAHHRVGLRVHARGVQRVVAAGDPQEPGALLVGLRARAAATSFSSRRERNGPLASRCATMFSASVRGDPGHPGQQRHGRGVDLDADGVHAVLDHGVERAGQHRFGHVVLVLADADRLRVDLHQLGQRVLQPAGDGDRAAQRHVEVGQLAGGVGRRGVHRRAGLGHHDLGQPGAPRGEIAWPAGRSRGRRCRCRWRPARRRARSTRRCRVASDCVPAVGGLVRVDGVGGDHLAGAVDDGHLDARCGSPGRGPGWSRLPAGAASSRSFRLAANTAAASRSADCRSRVRTSTLSDDQDPGPPGPADGVQQPAVGRAGRGRRSRTGRRSAARSRTGSAAGSAAAGSGSTVRRQHALRPRPGTCARIRCDGSLLSGSEKSK